VLVALGFAAAAGADKEKLHLTTADQAKARTVVLHLADLGGSASGWSGGLTKPPPDTPLNCAGFDPKESDLVVTGEAASDFSHTGLEFDNDVELLQTKHMVQLDWQRSVDRPSLLPCLRHALSSSLPANERFLSMKRLILPKVGDESAGFRGLIQVQTGGKKVKVLIDFLLLGVGRSEITLITTAPYAAASAVSGAEQHLEQVLAGRAQPAGTA
jgi:hypothetical protein